MKRFLLLASAAAVTLFAASAAEAAHVSWSIGINVPPVASYVSSGPVWAPAPIAYAPGPAVYAAPAPVYAPAPVVYDQPYVDPYIVPGVGLYPPVVVGARYRTWAPPVRWAPAPRGWDRHDGDHRGWDRHDRVHHEVDFRR
jgi:hypothetical protein